MESDDSKGRIPDQSTSLLPANLNHRQSAPEVPSELQILLSPIAGLEADVGPA